MNKKQTPLSQKQIESIAGRVITGQSQTNQTPTNSSVGQQSNSGNNDRTAKK